MTEQVSRARGASRLSTAIAAAGLIGLLVQPAAAQMTLSPAHPPIVRTDPNQSQVGLFCPKSAKASGDEPAPSGWSIYAGTFSLPLWNVAIMSNDATTDRLLCLYGGPVQLSLARTVAKDTCTVNAMKTGFNCK